MAVKVPNHNNSISKRVEEQFMAGVSTIGRTYYRNLVRLYGFFSILISGFEWRVIGGIIGCFCSSQFKEGTLHFSSSFTSVNNHHNERFVSNANK